ELAAVLERLVEVGEVVEELVRPDRRIGLDKAERNRAFAKAAAIARKMRAHHAPPVHYHFAREPLHAAEIQERNASVGFEHIVARMRTAIEYAVADDRPEHETIDDLGPAMAHVGRIAKHIGEAAARHELRREHEPGRVRIDHARNADERMPHIEIVEGPL